MFRSVSPAGFIDTNRQINEWILSIWKVILWFLFRSNEQALWKQKSASPNYSSFFLVFFFKSRRLVTSSVLSFPAVLTDRLILLSFLEQSQVAAVFLSQKTQGSPETGRRTDKLSPSEIKVQHNTLMESSRARRYMLVRVRRRTWR